MAGDRQINHYRFEPNYRKIAKFDGNASEEELLAERGVFAADLEFVQTNCGSLGQRLIDAVPDWYYQSADEQGLEINCDLRLHRLEPGQYPAAPGWHCDAAQREVAFANLDASTEVASSIVACISSDPGGVSNPQFLNEAFTIDSVNEYGNAPELWREVSEQLSETGACEDSADGEMILFDPWTLHRVRPAKCSGIRLFFRMSIWEKPLGHRPGLVKSEQVYNLIRTAD